MTGRCIDFLLTVVAFAKSRYEFEKQKRPSPVQNQDGRFYL